MRGQGCPYCKGRIPHPDDNLATTLPHIAAFWNYNKNERRPEDYRPHSGKIVWWKCTKGHEWSASIKSMSRIQTTSGCPYCYGKYPIKGETDFSTLHPELVLEWDYAKNKQEPSEYTEFSNKRVWWICPRRHSYAVAISSRTRDRGCSLCSRGWKSK